MAARSLEANKSTASDGASGTEPPPGTRPYAVVTGGSDGIGLAVAERLVAQGRAVLLVARTADRLHAAAEQVRRRARSGTTVAVLAADVTDPAAPSIIDRALADADGHLDLLVNSAGIGLAGPFVSHEPAEIERLLALNVTGLTRLMRHFLPALSARGAGGILNFASLGGYVPGPNQAAYYASKAYVISLSEAVASEMAASGVRVTVVSPGPVSTRFHARMGADNALYRWLIPPLRAETVAIWALFAHGLGLRASAPGIINSFMMLFLRILPHRIVVPVIGWLLKPRALETRHA